MSRNAAYREIERKLADSLAQLEVNKRTERLREARAFGDELKALMKSYQVSAADVMGILHSATELPAVAPGLAQPQTGHAPVE